METLELFVEVFQVLTIMFGLYRMKQHIFWETVIAMHNHKGLHVCDYGRYQNVASQFTAFTFFDLYTVIDTFSNGLYSDYGHCHKLNMIITVLQKTIGQHFN